MAGVLAGYTEAVVQHSKTLDKFFIVPPTGLLAKIQDGLASDLAPLSEAAVNQAVKAAVDLLLSAADKVIVLVSKVIVLVSLKNKEAQCGTYHQKHFLIKSCNGNKGGWV